MTYQDVLTQLYNRKCDKGCTLEAIEQAAGVSKSTVSRMFNGSNAPGILTFFKILESLNFQLKVESKTTYQEMITELERHKENKNYTLDDLAEKSGVSRSVLSRMLNGEPTNASAFFKAMGCLNIELCEIDDHLFPTEGLEPVDYRKIERFLEWKQLKKALFQANRSLREYESSLESSELFEFKKKYKKDKRQIKPHP